MRYVITELLDRAGAPIMVARAPGALAQEFTECICTGIVALRIQTNTLTGTTCKHTPYNSTTVQAVIIIFIQIITFTIFLAFGVLALVVLSLAGLVTTINTITI